MCREFELGEEVRVPGHLADKGQSEANSNPASWEAFAWGNALLGLPHLSFRKLSLHRLAGDLSLPYNHSGSGHVHRINLEAEVLMPFLLRETAPFQTTC